MSEQRDNDLGVRLDELDVREHNPEYWSAVMAAAEPELEQLHAAAADEPAVEWAAAEDGAAAGTASPRRPLAAFVERHPTFGGGFKWRPPSPWPCCSLGCPAATTGAASSVRSRRRRPRRSATPSGLVDSWLAASYAYDASARRSEIFNDYGAKGTTAPAGTQDPSTGEFSLEKPPAAETNDQSDMGVLSTVMRFPGLPFGDAAGMRKAVSDLPAFPGWVPRGFSPGGRLAQRFVRSPA